jgi:hypothetical protein
MGWELRGNNQYYYKKERDGSRVKSTYVGKREIAHMVSKLQSSSRVIERLARYMKSPHQEQEKAEAELDQLTDRIRLITHAALLASGFHAHKRQWRKKRHG